jgi:biotin carboxyl carrier protein
MQYVTTIEEREFIVEILDEHHIKINDVVYDIDFNQVGNQPVYSLIVDGQSYDTHVYQEDDRWQVLIHGSLYTAKVEDERDKRLRASLGGSQTEQDEFLLRAPMPGLIVSIPVNDGTHVEKGDVLLVLESMKMQNELKSPRAGSVSRLRVKPGDRVEQKETLLSVV